MKKGIFVNIKRISIILIILGLLICLVSFVSETKAHQQRQACGYTYSFYNPISGEDVHVSGGDILDLTFFEFLKSEYMNFSVVLVIPLILFAVFLAAAIVLYALYFNQELTLTEDRLCGKAVFGKQINQGLSKITAIKNSGMKGMILTTLGQEKIKFRFLKNRSELIEAISMCIAK